MPKLQWQHGCSGLSQRAWDCWSCRIKANNEQASALLASWENILVLRTLVWNSESSQILNFKPIKLYVPVFPDFSGPLSSCHLKGPELSALLQSVSPSSDLYTVVQDGRPLPPSPQRCRLKVTRLASPRWHQNQDPSLPLAGQHHPTTVPASGGWAHSIWGHGFSISLTNNNSVLSTPDGDSRDPASALWLLAAPTTPKTSGCSLRWSTNPFPAYSTSYNKLFFPVSLNKITNCIYPDTTSNTYFFWENNHLFPHNSYLFQCFELAAALPARVLLWQVIYQIHMKYTTFWVFSLESNSEAGARWETFTVSLYSGSQALTAQLSLLEVIHAHTPCHWPRGDT